MLDNDDIKFIKDKQKYSTENRFTFYIILTVISFVLYMLYMSPEYHRNDSLGIWVYTGFIFFYTYTKKKNWLKIINKLSEINYSEKETKIIINSRKKFKQRNVWLILFIIPLLIYLHSIYKYRYINIYILFLILFSAKMGVIAQDRYWLKLINKYYNIEKNEALVVNTEGLREV